VRTIKRTLLMLIVSVCVACGTGDSADELGRDGSATAPADGASGAPQRDATSEPTPSSLVPAVWPEVVVAGESTEVSVSVAPRGEVDGPVIYEIAGVSGELEDEGGVYAASLELVLTQDAELVVSATVGGSEVSGAVMVAVAEGGLPVLPAPAPVEPVTVVAPDGGQVLADRVLFRTVAGVSESELVAAAETVGGSVIGRLSASVWQVQIPVVGSYGELAAVLDGLEGQAGLEDAGTIGVDEADQGING
jgi:hypothetical protein